MNLALKVDDLTLLFELPGDDGSVMGTSSEMAFYLLKSRVIAA